ncbi:SDR family oxidoreductase [Actinomycetaceae bacterium MB13-C1-2]|nr:SDR family oxidoreductase [Actinomycetaceae bacterium MB13-C1-2]
MTPHEHPLNGHRTIKEWLAHPKGGPVIRGFFEQAGVDDATIEMMKSLPLGGMPGLSQGRFSQELVDKLILEANDGVMPEEEPELGATGQRFFGKTVIVTGAASGIGLATLRRIVSEGGRVIAVDMAAEKLEDVAANAPAGTVVPVAADITKDDDVARIMEAAGPKVDGLANVAGIMDGMMPLHETDNALWERVIAVNVTGSFKVSRAVLPLMIEAEEGAIVNVASQAALRGNAAGTAYGTSKHAIVGMTKSEAFLYGPLGIRVNAVAPGGVATGIEGAFKSEFAEKRMAPFLALLPPISTADTQAAAITWLLSDDAMNVNGIIMPTDGGWSVQ